MYFKPLNSPELKLIRDRVKYTVYLNKNSRLLTVINHTPHKTLIPDFNYDTIESSEPTDIIGDYNIITLNDNGKLFFKTDENLITDPNDYTVIDFTTETSSYTYHEFISYNNKTGELTPNIPFTYNNKRYTTNDECYYILEVPI